MLKILSKILSRVSQFFPLCFPLYLYYASICMNVALGYFNAYIINTTLLLIFIVENFCNNMIITKILFLKIFVCHSIMNIGVRHL